ncbi:Mus7/MMS22 family-domain-containing protein [Mycena amicta]|nr:Mus7/MMS22 family-domain-containing protein [Mycena amicta]
MASPAPLRTALPWVDKSDDDMGASDSPIVIEDHEDVQQTVEEPRALSRRELKFQKQLRILRRVYPAYMVDRMLEDASRPRRLAATASSSEDEEDLPKLQPGQSRVSKAKRPREPQPVLGDPESDDDKPPRSDGKSLKSDSDVEVVDHRRRNPRQQTSDTRAAARMDDEAINPRRYKAKAATTRSYDRYLIDWMLSNTADIGSHGRLVVKREHNGRSSETTGGPPRPRRGRQTLDSYFQRNPRPRQRDGAASRRTHRNPGPEYPPDDEEAEVDHGFDYAEDAILHDIPRPDVQRVMDQRQQERDRQALIKANGVHILPALRGSRIVGQRTDGARVDGVADDYRPPPAAVNRYRPARVRSFGAQVRSDDARPTLNRVLPHPRTRPRNRRLVRGAPGLHHPGRPRSPDSPTAQMSADIFEDDEEPESTEVWDSVQLLDFGISLVPAGTKFNSDTYTGKGFLSELVNPTEADKNPRPRICSAHDFDLGPNITTRQLSTILGPLCNRFFDFATGLPDSDNADQEMQWSALNRVVCHLVTSLLAAGDEADALKSAVETCVRALVSNLREAALTAEAMEPSTFSVCWFAVELAFRSGFRWDSRLNSDNVLNEACAVLVEYIVEYGLDRTMEPLVTQELLDGTTISHRALETLVGLWHLIHRSQLESSPTHPIWALVESALAKRPPSSERSSIFDGSERAWQAIIAVCTVSQFSAAGKVNARWAEDKSIPRTCWNIVKSTLDRLVHDIRNNNGNLSNVKDAYIKLVVERCCLLWSRWQWEFHGAVLALNNLGNFLRTRMFANLADEATEFPDFIRLNDWTLLARPIHSDETAFVLFLKLIYQTLLADKRQAGKLLSSAIPVTAAMNTGDLSTLINRISVLAIAIYIQPENHAKWIQRAREYVNFKDANVLTRLVYIRGFMYLSVLMAERRLEQPVGWLKEMMDVLIQELKTPTQDKESILCIQLLARALEGIILTAKGYPDVALLKSFFTKDLPPFFLEHDEDPGVLRLVQAFLDTRAALFRRRTPPQEQQESQDEYGPIDLDFAEAFVAQEAEDYRQKDIELFQIVDKKVRWPLWRRLEGFLSRPGIAESFKIGDDSSRDIASLAHSWACCGSVAVQQSSDKQLMWTTFLKTYFSKSEEWDYFCQCRVNLLVLYNVLQQDLAAYPTDVEALPAAGLLQDRFLAVFAECLVSWYTTSEAGYIELLLSIEGHQHPLLKGASWSSEVDVTATKAERLAARLPLLQTVLENIAECLGAGNMLQYANAMFAYMRRTHTELDDGTEEKRSYGSFCRQILEEFEKYPAVLQHERLQQWEGWYSHLQV